MSRLDPDEFVSVRKIEFKVSQHDHPFVSQLRMIDSAASSARDTLFGYIVESSGPPSCSKFEDEESARSAPARTLKPITVTKTKSVTPAMDLSMDVDDDDWVATLPAIVPGPPHTSKSTFSKTVSGPAVLGHTTRPAPFPMPGPITDLHRSHSTVAGSSSKSRAQPRLSSHIPINNPLLEGSETPAETANLPDFDPSDAIIFPAGSYEIILLLDTREVESKTNRDRIAEKLLDRGIKVETRALKLGDMCWIARRRDGIGGEEDECVLDYVAERKRLDDLCSSIRDGRYNEQCVSHVSRSICCSGAS